MFCKHCGNPIPNAVSFCEHCGQPIDGAVRHDARTEPMRTVSGIQPGFSDRIHSPAFREAIRKTKRGTGIFAVLLILAPIVVTLILSIQEDDFTALGIGCAISVIFLVINLISAARKKSDKQWDGVVVGKKTRTVQNRDIEDRGSKHYTEYLLAFRDENGKTKRYKEGTPQNDAHPFYEYLNVGDRVRYHPEFGGFYEKYDKSGDTHIYCPACGSWTAITEDTCDRCGILLLK